MAERKRNIVGFKKFSDLKQNPVEVDLVSLPVTPENELDRPMYPNLPENKTKKQVRAKLNEVPVKKEVKSAKEQDEDELENDGEIVESNVEHFGKLAKFKNTKASKAYNFLESVKISKKSIWYIMVEKDNELQMIKYNYKEGVDLNKFVNELKKYYIDKNKDNKLVCEAINNIYIDGNDKFSSIRNIPNIEMNNKKVITKITEDLIKLLSK
jgi:hypothetical protein